MGDQMHAWTDGLTDECGDRHGGWNHEHTLQRLVHTIYIPLTYKCNKNILSEIF